MKLNLNQEISQDSLRALYLEYKELLIPGIAILSSIILFLFVLLPQLSAIPQKINDRSVEMNKLNNLKKIQDYIFTLDKTSLESNLTFATNALPIDKNYQTSIGAISTAANLSNSQITGYQSAGDVAPGSIEVQEFPSLAFSVSLEATPQQAIEFVNQIYQTFPVSNVTSFDLTATEARFNINFYYKPFPPSTQIDRSAITEINQGETATLTDIAQWGNSGQNQNSIEVVNNIPATESATRTSPFGN